MSIRKQILEEINSVRTNPSGYVDKILKYKDYFKGKILYIPGEKVGIQTNEGASAYEEAANYLKTAKNNEAFIPSKGLTNIANDYLNKVLEVGMDKIDDIDMNDIIDEYGSFTKQFNQLLELGSTTVEQIVISLLVSDGDSTREYRKHLLSPNLKKIGIASKKDNTNKNLTIIVASTDFKNKDDSDDKENFEENEEERKKREEDQKREKEEKKIKEKAEKTILLDQKKDKNLNPMTLIGIILLILLLLLLFYKLSGH